MRCSHGANDPPPVEAVQGPHRGEERFLRDVLRGGRVMHHEPRGAVRPRPVAPEELGERFRRPALRGAHERGLARALPPAPAHAGAQRLDGRRLNARDRRTDHVPITRATPREVPGIIRAVTEQFLPPDPDAEAQPPPLPAARPAFLPPTTPPPAPAQRKDNRSTLALGLGAGALGVLFFTAGMLFFLTLPASIVAWTLGNRAKGAPAGGDQANLAVIIGIVGVVFGAIAGVVWILLVSLGDVSNSTDSRPTRTENVHFDVIRLVAALAPG
jgi:hypothetical protein